MDHKSKVQEKVELVLADLEAKINKLKEKVEKLCESTACCDPTGSKEPPLRKEPPTKQTQDLISLFMESPSYKRRCL